jgi:hypothetical protein
VQLNGGAKNAKEVRLSSYRAGNYVLEGKSTGHPAIVLAIVWPKHRASLAYWIWELAKRKGLRRSPSKPQKKTRATPIFKIKFNPSTHNVRAIIKT